MKGRFVTFVKAFAKILQANSRKKCELCPCNYKLIQVSQASLALEVKEVKEVMWPLATEVKDDTLTEQPLPVENNTRIYRL